METIDKIYTVAQLLEHWSGGIKVNPEYQRGAVWTEIQKQMLIDSIFRGYPLPLFYFHRIASTNLDGNESYFFEVIDGQQRLRAMSEFKNNRLRLLDPAKDSKKMRLPSKVKSQPCPWGGKAFNELDPSLQDRFLTTNLHVQIISAANAEEVRDLFIRLQSGTSLSRQQVRDAWPGNIGPFIESIAGKGTMTPKIRVFQFIDNRGNREDDLDGTDPYVNYRQSCAQALLLFLHKVNNPSGQFLCSITAKDLDNLYHEHTDFDRHGATAKRFELVLDLSRQVLQKSNQLRDDGTVFKKLEIHSLMLLLEEMTRDPANLVEKDIPRIANAFEKARKAVRDSRGNVGKATGASVIEDYYQAIYWAFIPHLLIDRLDPVRFFTTDQRNEIRTRDRGVCQICLEPVEPADEEFDHLKPWLLGGRTVVDNGRLVHARCHPRGRRAIQPHLESN